MKHSMRTDRQSLVAELESIGAAFKGNECPCPFHNDQHASAGIYQDEMGVWRFKCQSSGCGIGGDYWDIRAKNTNKTLAELFRESTPADVSMSAPVAATSPRRQKPAFPTIDKAAEVITDQITARYKYTCPVTGKVQLVIFRIETGSGKTFRQISPVAGGWQFKAPAKPWPIYNRKRIMQAESVVIVEGEGCVHALQAYGIVATTSPCGAGKAEHADWSMLHGKTVVLWPDHDEAGNKHMLQIRNILEAHPDPPEIQVVDPVKLELDPKEDVVDYIQQLEVQGYDRDRITRTLQDVIGQSQPARPSEEVIERIEKSIDGSWAAVELPWRMLERLTHPLLPGCICMLVGSVGHGKSYLLLDALADFHHRGYKVACLELEEDRTYHLSRVLAQQAAIPELVDPQWVRQNADLARGKYAEHKDFLESFGQCLWAEPDEQQTLDQVAAWVAARANDGCRILAIDPITAAVGTDKPWIADNAFLQKIKRTASQTGCSIILVTHPTKAYLKPDVNTLAGSAAYSRFAQSIIWLMGHTMKTSTVKGIMGTAEVEHDRTLMIMKARNGKGGGLGLAFEMDRETLRLKEIGIIVKESK